MREGITTTESLKNLAEKPIPRVSIDANKYAELKHVQKSFSSNLYEIEKIIKNMETEIKEINEMVGKLKERSDKYLRF